MNVECLNKISDTKFVERTNTFKVDSFSKSKKLTRKYFDYLKKTIDQINKGKDNLNIPEFGIENDFF